MTDDLDNPRILEETNANWYVLKPDGTTENIPKSPENRLLYEHNLYGLLREGGDILVFNDRWDGPRVRVVASEDAREYELEVGEGEPIHLGVHLKADLVDALIDVYEDGDSVKPLARLYDSIRADRVRSEVVDELAGRTPFSSVIEQTPDGWLIHDHLLLTWEGDFHHPNTTAYTRRGNTVAEGSSEIAYDLRLRQASVEGSNRELTVDDTTYRLTDAEMEFVAKATWGLKYAPRMEDDDD